VEKKSNAIATRWPLYLLFLLLDFDYLLLSYLWHEFRSILIYGYDLFMGRNIQKENIIMNQEEECFDYALWENVPNHAAEAGAELMQMRVNIERMRYMMGLGWFCKEYSEEEWLKFKEYEVKLIKYK
jgi:hypothetical protein